MYYLNEIQYIVTLFVLYEDLVTKCWKSGTSWGTNKKDRTWGISFLHMSIKHRYY